MPKHAGNSSSKPFAHNAARKLARKLGTGLSVAPASATVGGIVGYAAAHTSSLLPRTPLFQGVISAVSGSFGFHLGLLANRALQGAKTGSVAPSFRNAAAPISARSVLTASAMAIGLVGAPFLALESQRKITRYCQVDEPGATWALASAGIAAATLASFGALWRATEAAIDQLAHHLGSRKHWEIATRLVSATIIYAGLLISFDQIILRGAVKISRTVSDRLDNGTQPGVDKPTIPTRSGSTTSAEAWNELGKQGRLFVSSGPSRARIEQVTGAESLDPIRVYAALNNRDLLGVAQAILREMDRTNAWHRSAICIVTTTGRGNANEWSASAFEYLTGGDCCTIATQYSGLPSAITLFLGREQPVQAATILFTAIKNRVATMSADERPRIYLAGESLGAFGSNGIFNNSTEMLKNIDGAVWLGTPHFTPMHQYLTNNRDNNSPVIVPVIDNGRHIRFAGKPEHLTTTTDGKELGPWQHPRICYLQNDTDPVVWWATPLLYKRPEWLSGTRAKNTPMAWLRWQPFVTFWQLAADMPVCVLVPEGFGHKYHANQITPAWAGVLGMDSAGDYSTIINALISDITSQD